MKDVSKQILDKFKNIEYGNIDSRGKIHRESDSDFNQAEFKDYRLQSVEEVEANQIGVCWDQVEYARYLFDKHNIPTKSYAIVYYDHENNNYFNHTILTFQDDGKYYWFENSMKHLVGVHSFSSLKELLMSLKDEFLASQSKTIPAEYKKDRLYIWKYDAIPSGSNPAEVFKTWENGENMNEVFEGVADGFN